MKKLSIVFLAVVMAVSFGLGNAFAEQPASKATCQAGDLSLIKFESAAPVFTQIIHTPSQKDLFIDVSLECGLTTNTKVISKKLATAMATAEATVKVWVEVDGEVAVPGVVTFARRTQDLIAEFAGDISGALSIVEGVLVIDESLIDPEMLQLILDTMTANSFGFMVTDLVAGDHTVVVWADLSYLESTGGQIDPDTEEVLASGEAFATAYLGKGSVTVECVRMVKGEDVVLE